MEHLKKSVSLKRITPADGEIIYNSLIANEFVGVLLDIYLGKKRYLDRK